MALLSIIGESLRESPYYPHANSIKMGAGWPLLDADKTKWTLSKHKTHVFDVLKHSNAPLRHFFWRYCPYSVSLCLEFPEIQTRGVVTA